MDIDTPAYVKLLSPLTQMDNTYGLYANVLAIVLMTVTNCLAQDNLQGTEHHDEYCDTEVFRAECSVGEVILAKKALYGRMRLGRCVETNLGYLPCKADAIRVVDSRCSGRRTCEIRIPDTELERMRPCLKELKTYLEVSYICLKVESVTSEFCEFHPEVNLTRSHGFISSTTMLDAPACDGSGHPWVITAHPGQQINLTLYDFAAEVVYGDTNEDGTASENVIEFCHEYGIIEDAEGVHTERICGGTRRVSHIYLSAGHIIKLWVTNSNIALDMKYFMVEYTVIGCPDIPSTDYLWFKRPPRGSDVADLRCVYSDTRWQMRCDNHRWVGSMTNCSRTVPEVHDESQRQSFPVTYGIAIAIIIGAVLGVALIICIVGLVRYRRRPRARRGCQLNGRETVLLQARTDCLYETKIPVNTVTNDNCKQVNVDSQTYLPTYKMPNVMGTPCTQHCRHQRHPVKVNGNEYEHIWEAPLPRPIGTLPIGTIPCKTDAKCTIATLPRANVANAHAAALAFTTFKAPDVIHGTDPGQVPEPDRSACVRNNDVLHSPVNRKVIDNDGGKYSSLRKPPNQVLNVNPNAIHANV